jgi:hypothetical protein
MSAYSRNGSDQREVDVLSGASLAHIAKSKEFYESTLLARH